MGWFTRLLQRRSSVQVGRAAVPEAGPEHEQYSGGRYVAPGDHSIGILLETDAFITLMRSGRLLGEVAFDVHMRCGAVVRGRATAATAAWTCPCGSNLDMMSEAATLVTGGLLTRCPECGRTYWLGQGLSLVAVYGVWETGSGAAAGSSNHAG